MSRPPIKAMAAIKNYCEKTQCRRCVFGFEERALHNYVGCRRRQRMTEKKLDKITEVVRDAVINFLDIDKADLLDIVVSLHNELCKEVDGEYCDYSYHWANLGYGGCPNDNLFKEAEK